MQEPGSMKCASLDSSLKNKKNKRNTNQFCKSQLQDAVEAKGILRTRLKRGKGTNLHVIQQVTTDCCNY